MKYFAPILLAATILACFAAVIFISTAPWAFRQAPGSTQTVHAQTSNLGSLSGYAWSDNLGWISFSGNNYQVVVQSDGTLAGYAWANPSDDADNTNNIGWISFNAADTATCGVLPPGLRGTEFGGWAKVLAGGSDNIWNGCIAINGTISGGNVSYGATLNSSGSSQSGTLDGFSWAGSPNGGWISFNCDTGGPTGNNICATSNYAVVYTTAYVPPPPPPYIATFIGPIRVRAGNTATVQYIVTNPPASCNITGVTATTTILNTNVSPVSGMQGSVQAQVYGNTLFTLTCGTASQSVDVGIVPVTTEK